VSWRERQVVSSLGELKLVRPYYHCRQCGTSDRSWEDSLRVGERQLTVAAEELVALAGVLSGFEEAAHKTLRKLAGMRLSESTVRRASEDAGGRLAWMLRERVQFQAPTSWRWHQDAQGRTCAYVSVDATGVRQQGPGAAQAEGRMAYVGMLYNPPRRGESGKIQERRYLAGLYDLVDLGRQLHQEAMDVGWHQAEVQIALSDGAVCLEKFLATYFPRATLILDFWHAAEHLAELARTLYSEEEVYRQWLGQWCTTMKHQGGAAVLSALEQLDQTGWSAEAQDCWRRETGYLRNNLSRMDYPRYVEAGWHIGSGPIEAACKTVIGARMKGAGMRWGADGTNTIATLRACYLSEPARWEAFWNASYLQN
jgi:hypothetical protein